MKNSEEIESSRVRLDKWLWAARFFKTRNLAIEAINGGKIHLNQQRIKPAKEIHLGDEVRIRKGNLELTVIVKTLSIQRRSATEAAHLYEETAGSVTKRQQQADLHQQNSAYRPHGTGRPTKKDRRLIHHFVRPDTPNTHDTTDDTDE
jgi:ribosome-associated heat shock protein Hsp15